MALPAFLTQLQGDEFRRRLRLGVTYGYAVTGTLLVLAVVLDGLGLLPNAPVLYAVALVKLGTNSLQWLAVRRDRFMRLAASVNMITDVIAVTALIYFTGGPHSSLLPTYLIVLAIVGGLSNAGVTIVLAAMMAVAYTAMLLLMKLGVLVQHPTIGDRLALSDGGLGWDFVVIDSLKVLLFLAALTLSVASVLRVLRRKERELREAHDDLLEAIRRRDEFVATVTHELKTPIHGILGMTEVLQEEVYGPLTPRQVEALDSVSGAGMRLLAMVENLLQFERAQAGTLTIRNAEFDPREMLESAVESVQWAAMDKGVEVDVDVGPSTVCSDERLFRHVTSNLVSNAMRFSSSGGRVEVVLRRDDGMLRLSVSDDGPGIAEHEREALFDEFWQVKDSARAFGGTGLSLAVVRRIVDALGGTIDVCDEDGTTFRIQIPEADP